MTALLRFVDCRFAWSKIARVRSALLKFARLPLDLRLFLHATHSSWRHRLAQSLDVPSACHCSTLPTSANTGLIHFARPGCSEGLFGEPRRCGSGRQVGLVSTPLIEAHKESSHRPGR
jgi:hypothetical protein